MKPHTFDQLGKTWTLFQRKATPGAPYYFAPRWGENKQKVFHCLKDKTTGAALSLAAAELAARDLITAHFRGPDQYAALRDATKLRQSLTVGKILTDYRAAGCQDRRGRPRTGAALEAEHRNILALQTFWTSRLANGCTDKDRDDYWAHRRATVSRGTGDRTTELELTTLNNALQWSWRRGDLKELPRSTKTAYRDSAEIAHARDAMPSSGDEVHALAAELFRQPETVVHGWAVLLGALTGLRRGELEALKARPQRHGVHVEPGWYDDRVLVVPRSKRRAGKSQQGEFLLTDPTRAHVRPLLEMIRSWHAATHPDDPRLLPMAADSLSKRLQAAAKRLGLPGRRAHGLRAYYATARLASNISASQVADELGQLGSGDDLVRTIYGNTPPQWRGLENVFTWVPNTADKKPAWTWWKAPANITALPAAANPAPELATAAAVAGVIPGGSAPETANEQDTLTKALGAI
jgi:integrase